MKNASSRRETTKRKREKEGGREGGRGGKEEDGGKECESGGEKPLEGSKVYQHQLPGIFVFRL